MNRRSLAQAGLRQSPSTSVLSCDVLLSVLLSRHIMGNKKTAHQGRFRI
jgi:hypothetical protein